MINFYSSVVSYHTNPYTCGVARFNQALAKEMRIPLCSVSKFVPSSESISLLSIKFEEMSAKSAEDLWAQLDQVDAKFDLFLHGVTQSKIENQYINSARRVIVATREYAEIVRAQRHDVLSYFAPGAADSSKKTNVDITLLTFGMAHKIRSDGYRKLGEILTADERSVQLEISTALHDGTSFSEDFFSVG